ncbi:Proline-rich nuclear receptor coactivator [Thalictrum thalictroides]|uniref:Proline-rich nuclear receptor coactivator n=1 Tax=Thalictrum thalictroides TaxID=46969 RepID=A0A7J6X407_THATH|nr:Proline-rich nuclear receptor coactivator [Thalictrum thalictroides]
MGTEVLRPQDCFIERMRFNPSVLPRRKAYNSGSNTHTKSHRKSSESKKRFQAETSSISKVVDESKQITILKRGETIEFINKRKNENLVKKKASFSGGDLVVRIKEQQQQNLFLSSCRSEEIYAGSACFSSPSPRKLPLPTFSKKKEGLKMIDDESATKDLRRLLRLD